MRLPPTQRHCPPPPAWLPAIYSSHCCCAAECRLFPAHRLKKGSSVRPSPSSPTFVSLAPTPVRSPDRGHLSALCDSNCRPRRSCARRRCSTPMCELLVVCRWRKGNVRGVVRPCRGRWSAWSFTRNHRSLQVAGCSVVRPWAPGLHARVAVEEGGVEPR